MFGLKLLMDAVTAEVELQDVPETATVPPPDVVEQLFSELDVE